MMDQSAVRRWGVLAHDSFITTSLPAQHVRNYQDFFMLLLVSIQRQQATLIPLANCNCFTFVKKKTINKYETIVIMFFLHIKIRGQLLSGFNLQQK